ncbi:MAG: hypothetical protein WDM89_07405 [Rhizomicrobium sp.]
MDDLALEILLAAAVLVVVLRACWQGNPWPCFWTAIGAALMAVAAIVRHLEMSDIIVPSVTAVFAALIGHFSHKARRKNDLAS